MQPEKACQFTNFFIPLCCPVHPFNLSLIFDPDSIPVSRSLLKIYRGLLLVGEHLPVFLCFRSFFENLIVAGRPL